MQAFVKAQKSKAYFKRFQVKFKRRRGIAFVFHDSYFILFCSIFSFQSESLSLWMFYRG